MSNENFAAAVDAVFEDPTQLSDAQFEDAVTAVFDGPLSDAQFEDAVEAVFEDTKTLSDEQFDAAVQAVFDEPLTTEQFTEALGAVFDEPITDEKFDAIIDAVLDEPITDEQFEELVNVLESETVTEEQVAAAVDSVIENGVTEEQATDLATSEKVLESIDGDQATEIFDAVDIGAVTLEEAAQLVAAVQEAPTEVREAMESEINVFQGAIDTYVPLGSSVPIGTRRVIIGASALAIFCAPVPTSRRN
jgi:transcriptional regulator CtsR